MRTKIVFFTVASDLGAPLSFGEIHAFISRAVIGVALAVTKVFGVSTFPKVRSPLIEFIAIAMVNNLVP